MFFLLLINIAFSNNFTDSRITEWIEVPSIQVCDNISSLSVVSSLDYWQKKGKSFNKITFDKCEEFEVGKIYIMLDESLDKDKPANATTYYGLRSKKITKSFIRIHPEFKDEVRILTHEIGHALGYKHSDNKDSVMHHTLYY